MRYRYWLKRAGGKMQVHLLCLWRSIRLSFFAWLSVCCAMKKKPGYGAGDFLRVWLSLDKYRPEFRFSTWLYRVSCNICYDRLRALQHSPAGALSDITFAELPVCSDDNIEATLVNRELKAHILYFMQQLTPKQKLVFTLRDIEELEIKEIEKITGFTSVQIKANLYLARKSIRKKLNEINKER